MRLSFTQGNKVTIFFFTYRYIPYLTPFNPYNVLKYIYFYYIYI
nr:MAG TPA: hypothetical protein [Caudoviricetes sp.]